MQITPKIARAIEEYVNANGGAMRLVDALNVNDATAIRIGKGRAKTVRASTWQKLEPLIRPYLDATPDVPKPPRLDEITVATVDEMKALTQDNRRKVYRFTVETRINQDNGNGTTAPDSSK